MAEYIIFGHRLRHVKPYDVIRSRDWNEILEVTRELHSRLSRYVDALPGLLIVSIDWVRDRFSCALDSLLKAPYAIPNDYVRTEHFNYRFRALHELFQLVKRAREVNRPFRVLTDEAVILVLEDVFVPEVMEVWAGEFVSAQSVNFLMDACYAIYRLYEYITSIGWFLTNLPEDVLRQLLKYLPDWERFLDEARRLVSQLFTPRGKDWVEVYVGVFSEVRCYNHVRPYDYTLIRHKVVSRKPEQPYEELRSVDQVWRQIAYVKGVVYLAPPVQIDITWSQDSVAVRLAQLLKRLVQDLVSLRDSVSWRTASRVTRQASDSVSPSDSVSIRTSSKAVRTVSESVSVSDSVGYVLRLRARALVYEVVDPAESTSAVYMSEALITRTRGVTESITLYERARRGLGPVSSEPLSLVESPLLIIEMGSSLSLLFSTIKISTLKIEVYDLEPGVLDIRFGRMMISTAAVEIQDLEPGVLDIRFGRMLVNTLTVEIQDLEPGVMTVECTRAQINTTPVTAIDLEPATTSIAPMTTAQISTSTS